MCINNSIQKYVNILDSNLSKRMIYNISIGFSADMFWQVLYNECWFMLGWVGIHYSKIDWETLSQNKQRNTKKLSKCVYY